MENHYSLDSELKENYHALARSKVSEEQFIQVVDASFKKLKAIDIKLIENILDLTLVVVDNQGEVHHRQLHSNNIFDHHDIDLGPKKIACYDADDEGADEACIFPCHFVYDDCHPELLCNYHNTPIKSIASTQLIRYPKLCEYVIDFMFDCLVNQSNVIQTIRQDIVESVETESTEYHLLGKYLEAMMAIIRKLDRICLSEKRNCRVLSRTRVLDTILTNILYLLEELPDKQHIFMDSLLKLTFTLSDYKINGDHFKQLLAVIKNENSDLKIVLGNLERILNHQYKIMRNIRPLKTLNFPTASKTAEEVESDAYVSNSWHSRLRSRVIEFKRKQSRSNNQVLLGQTVKIFPEENQSDSQTTGESSTSEANITKTTPSWLECSLMAPLSNISPLIHNNDVTFCCSLWMSVCGDLLVIDGTKARKFFKNGLVRSDWRSLNGHWLRLSSRRQLARRKKRRIRRSRARRPSYRMRRRVKQDEEDDEEEEIMERNRRSQMELNQVTYSIFGPRIKSNKLHNQSVGSNSPKNYATDRKRFYARLPKEYKGRRSRDNSQEFLMHIISFAFDTLTIEIWLNVRWMTFCARACRVAREGQSILLDQVTFPSHLDSHGSWSHVLFCVEEMTKPQHLHEKVLSLKLLINGVYKEREKLVYSAHKSPLTNFACLVGCERSTFGYVWKLSQFSIFKAIPPSDIPIYLLGKGPDFWSLSNFRQSSALPLHDLAQRSIKNLMNPRLLELYGSINEERALNWLTQNVILIYVVHKPYHFLDYSPSMKTSSIVNPLPADFDLNNTAERFIQAKILNFSRSFKFNNDHGFGSALVEAGGIESILVCFAEVVRRSQETCLAHHLALSILFKLSQTNSYNLAKFLDELNGLKLVEFILVHPDCKVSEAMLEKYLEFCLAKKGRHSLIKSPKLLFHLLSSWRAWHKDPKVARQLYRKLIRLLRPSDFEKNSNPEERRLESHYIDHNFKMITDADGIDLLMGILRECLVPLDENVPKINHELVELIVNLISMLIKHPPGLDVMLDIMEFLLVIHPDHKAYVEVVPSGPSFLRDLELTDTETNFHFDSLNYSRAQTPFSDTQSISNSDETEMRHLNSGDLTMRTSSSDDVFKSFDDLEEPTRLKRSSSELTRQRLNTITENNLPSMPTYEDPAIDETQSDQQPRPVTQAYPNCSYRNFAIANIADMLASIVKLTMTDPQKVLSEALQKPIIDARKLVILANNNVCLVREKVLRLFLYCIRACYSLNLRSILTKYEREYRGSRFKGCVPIQLMACQLLKYPTSMKMIQLCYSIIVGIEDFETVDSVCLTFDVESMNSNLQLNTLILLIQLMTQLVDHKEIVSAVKFVYAYVKQLSKLGEDSILSILIKNFLIDAIMKLYFVYVDSQIKFFKQSISEQQNRSGNVPETNQAEDSDAVRKELDRMLLFLVRHCLQTQTTSESAKSIYDLLTYFDVMNTHIPGKFQPILRDRKVKILIALIGHCQHYEACARQRNYGGKFEYYLKSFFKNNDVNIFPNVLTNSLLRTYATLFEEDQHTGTSTSSVSINVHPDLSQPTTNGPVVDCTVVDKLGALEPLDDHQDDLLTECKKINDTDVVERFRATIEFSVHFVITREAGVIPSPHERTFIIRLIQFLAQYIEENQQAKTARNSNQKSLWFLIFPKLERQMRTSLTRLILYLLSPCESMNLDERKYYAAKILELFEVQQLLGLLDESNERSSFKVLSHFVLDLLDYRNSSFPEEICEDNDDEILLDDTESKLVFLIRCIEMGNLPDLLIDVQVNKTSRLKISSLDKNPALDSRSRDHWLMELAQMREENRERLLVFAGDKRKSVPADSPDIGHEHSSRISDEAVSITRDVVNDKNEQRKAYLEDLKQNKVCNYHVRQQWLSLILAHTHERAIWFMNTHHPKSWELNPVEGPSRIRRRLRPCKLILEPRYLRQTVTSKWALQSMCPHERAKHVRQTSDKVDQSPSDIMLDDWYNEYSPHPLCSMVLNQEQHLNFRELRIRMFTTDKIHFNCDCSIIRPNEVCDGEVSIASWCIHFIGERSDGFRANERYSQFSLLPQIRRIFTSGADEASLGGRTNSSIMHQGSPSLKNSSYRRAHYNSTIVEDLWFDEIVEIWDRRYQLQDVGLEIFLTNNMTYLISFRSNRDREGFKQSLMREQHKMINLQRFNLTTSLAKLTQYWREGRLTNFDYLTSLNKLAGRSFNDLMQYPVFPFVLSDYTSKVLDLKQASNFRKLKRPMAIQNRDKEATFINHYHDTQSSNISIGLNMITKPYHYGNHYSNSASVLHFLVRLPPFTQMLIQYQDNNFDQPDRTFHSMANTWQLITCDSNTDFKELIPEFFFLPEIFLNFENFELGRKQNNELLDDVVLPPWCPNADARLFTLIHRQALEADHVSENLHHWIDLIFGCKQTGKAAIEAMNVFHPATYYGAIDLGNNGSTSNSSTHHNSTFLTSTTGQSYSSDYIFAKDSKVTMPSTSTIDSGSARRPAQQRISHDLVDIERQALETMIKTYGQMPRQLFSQSLKQRSMNSDSQGGLITSVLAGSGTRVASNQDSKIVRRDLSGKTSARLEPLSQVKGLKWGSFVGSPDEGDITAAKHKRLILKDTSKAHRHIRGHDRSNTPAKVLHSLYLLPNGDIAVLQNNTSLMLEYRADRKSSGTYQLSLPSARYSRRAGLSNVARMNLFSNMIINQQQFNYIEPAHLTASQFESPTSSASSLISMGSPGKTKFSTKSLSLVSWDYLDGTIRVRQPAFDSQKPSTPLVQADSIVDAMTTCCSVPELNLLLVGYQSGSICAHIVSTSHEVAPIPQYKPSLSLSASASSISSMHHYNLRSTGSSSTSLTDMEAGVIGSQNSQASFPSESDMSHASNVPNKTLQNVKWVNKTTRWLNCHTKKINCMRINVSFSIVVTASDDGTTAIWDLNSLTFVRSIDYSVRLARLRKEPPRSKSPLIRDRRASYTSSNSFASSSSENDAFTDYLCNCPDQNSTCRKCKRQQKNSLAPRQECICGYGVQLVAVSDTLGDIVSIKNITNRLAHTTDDDEIEGVNLANKVDEHSFVQQDSELLYNLIGDAEANANTPPAPDKRGDNGFTSVLYVHTINGSLVGFVNCHNQVTAVCYSNAPEGISVNVIVVGFADGLIRMYSSWDLSRVKEFHVSGLISPVSSILYSRDNLLLYVTYEDSQLVVLRNRRKRSVSLPKEWFP